MLIQLSPQRSDSELSVTKAGDVLTINGEVFDFTGLPDGATVENVPCDFIVGPVDRVDGEIKLTLLLPCGHEAPQERLFPAPIADPADGPITFPGDAA